jgi:PKD repeat protein
MLLFTASTIGKEKVVFVTYGPEAPANSGDYYYRQFIHFKIPEIFQQKAYIRFYDLACGGEYDSKYGDICSGYEVILFKEFIDENSFTSGLNYADVTGKPILLSKTIAEDQEYMNSWKTFASIDQSNGTLKDGYRYYSFSIRGLKGNDANGFDVFLSSSEDANTKIPGADIICFEPTLRIPKRGIRSTFRIKSDNEETSYNVRNFDFDNIDLGYSTFLKKYTTIYGSDDGSWSSARFTIGKHDVGKDIGITIGPNYSSKIENDLVFSVINSRNQKVPIIYPPEEYDEETLPILVTSLTYLDDCKTVEFRADNSNDPSNHELKAKWFFEDGSEADGFIVKKTFTTEGKFSPEVLLFNSSNDITRAVIAKVPGSINNPPTAVAGTDKISALNEDLNFDASSSSDTDGKIVSYKWDFGDGNSSSGIRTKHSYDKPGLYKVTLSVEDNFAASPCRFSESSLNVFVNSKPIAVTPSDLIGSTDEVINFNGEGSSDSDGSISQYLWDFGQFGKKEGKTVTHSFPLPGTYKVKLIVTDNSGAKNNSDSKEVILKINHPPVSKPGTDLLVAIDEQIFFDGSKSSDKDGQIINYVWDFGDGNSGTGVSVSHSYNKSGSYKVTLIVTDNSTTKTASTSASVSVIVNEPPVAKIGEDKFITSGYTSFDGSSSFDSDGNITKYLWDFGNGKKAEGVKVNNAFMNPGVYNVQLKVIDNTKVVNNYAIASIKVTVNARPVAKAGENMIVAPKESFTLSAKNSYDSDGEIIKYIWTKGKEILSNEETFNYEFENEGQYQINLSVQDNSIDPGSDYQTISVLVNHAPKSIITAPKSAMINEPIKFDAGLSTDFEGEISEYKWEFGDETTADGKVVSKSFTKSGRYNVKLTVKDQQKVSNSVSTTQRQIFINSSPIAKTVTSIKTCDKIITFDASASVDPDGDFLSYRWDFFDGSPQKEGITVQYNFEKPGVYPVLLIVDDNNAFPNSRDSISISVEINAPPIAIIGNDSTICTGDILILNGLNSKDPEGGALKYEWFFDDGSSLEGESISKIWKKSGVYQVMLKVTDNSGLPCNIDYDTKLITVLESPVAYAGEDISACINTPVFFDGSKSTDIDGVVDAFDWDFGDGEFGSGPKPIHIYKLPGSYKVTLIVTGSSNGRCDNKGYDELTVTVKQGPTAIFTSTDSVAKGETVYFDASASTTFDGAITSYNWDFGNGEFATGLTTSHEYKKSGNYMVKLTINTDSQSECNKTAMSKNIFVNEQPIAAAGEDQKVSALKMLILDGSKSIDADGNISEFAWDLGNGDIKYGRIISHSLSKSGKYPVILTVKDNTEISNNRNSDTVFISVNEAPVAVIESIENIYEGSTINLDGSKSYDSENDKLSYKWYLNNQELEENASQINHKFFFPGKYNVKLEVTDNSELSENKSVYNKLLNVYSIPKIKLGYDTTICVRTVIDFKPIISSSTISTPLTEWFINDELITTSNSFLYEFRESGNFKIIAKFYDKANYDGVLSSDTMMVVVNSTPKNLSLEDRVEFIGAANDHILFDVSHLYTEMNSDLSFTWEFGDKSTAYGKKVYHRYDKPGNYTVTLRIDDGKKTKCSLVITRCKISVKEY